VLSVGRRVQGSVESASWFYLSAIGAQAIIGTKPASRAAHHPQADPLPHREAIVRARLPVLLPGCPRRARIQPVATPPAKCRLDPLLSPWGEGTAQPLPLRSLHRPLRRLLHRSGE